MQNKTHTHSSFATGQSVLARALCLLIAFVWIFESLSSSACAQRGGWGGQQQQGQGGWGGQQQQQGGWGDRQRGDQNQGGNMRGGGGPGGGGGRGGGMPQFDPTEMLKRMDTNGDGFLDPSEVPDRAKRMVERFGFNPDERIEIAKVARAIRGEKEENNEPAKSSKADIARKVPGFGSDAPNFSPPPGFGLVSAPAANVAGGLAGTVGGGLSSLAGSYSSEVIESVERTLARYDKDGDGVLNKEEMSALRWSTPTSAEADTNGDGILTAVEIAERFKRRDAISNAPATREDSGRGGGGRSNDEQRVGSRGGNDNNSGNDSRTEATRRESRTSTSTDERQKNREYAEGLFKQHDKDGDGKLSADEIKGIRRFPQGADLDGDGFVTLAELEEALNNPPSDSGGSSATRSEPASSGGGSTQTTSRFSRNRTPASSGNSDSGGDSSFTAGGPFSSYDKNNDGMIQMYEFATEWNDKVLAEFRRLDLNGDGVITYEEFRKASGR